MLVTERDARAAFEAYFDALSRPDVTVERMLDEIVTDDFETGFAEGYRWRGRNGLRDFLAARAGFVDERHDVREVLEIEDSSRSEARVRTRLEFRLGQPSSNEQLPGAAFHTWLLRRDVAGRLRVAAEIVDGFDDLNEPAARLFSKPEQGLDR
jgi:hypothetical protein